MDKETLLLKVQERLDEVFEELDKKNDILRGDIEVDPDKYQEVDSEATRLDGRLEELNWIKDLLNSFQEEKPKFEFKGQYVRIDSDPQEEMGTGDYLIDASVEEIDSAIEEYHDNYQKLNSEGTSIFDFIQQKFEGRFHCLNEEDLFYAYTDYTPEDEDEDEDE